MKPHGHGSSPTESAEVEATRESLRILTLAETATELRCSRAHLYRVLNGKIHGSPPLPAFHVGRRVLVRQVALQQWIRAIEAREREMNYATGFCGLRNDELEFIAGA